MNKIILCTSILILIGCDQNTNAIESYAYDSTGVSLEFPQGIDGTPVAFDVSETQTYSVPAGKTLYITSCQTYPIVEGIHYGTDGNCPMFPQNTNIYGSDTTGYTGLLFDNSNSISPVYFPLDKNLNAYTTPMDKILILRSGTGQAAALTVDGIAYTNTNGVWVIPSGSVLGTVSTTPYGFTGYLKNE